MTETVETDVGLVDIVDTVVVDDATRIQNFHLVQVAVAIDVDHVHLLNYSQKEVPNVVVVDDDDDDVMAAAYLEED